MNKENDSYFLQWYSPDNNCWYNHYQISQNMRLTELVDYLQSLTCHNRLYRIVHPNNFKIDSYWYGGQRVVISEVKTVTCGKYSLMPFI